MDAKQTEERQARIALLAKARRDRQTEERQANIASAAKARRDRQAKIALAAKAAAENNEREKEKKSKELKEIMELGGGPVGVGRFLAMTKDREEKRKWRAEGNTGDWVEEKRRRKVQEYLRVQKEAADFKMDMIQYAADYLDTEACLPPPMFSCRVRDQPTHERPHWVDLTDAPFYCGGCLAGCVGCDGCGGFVRPPSNSPHPLPSLSHPPPSRRNIKKVIWVDSRSGRKKTNVKRLCVDAMIHLILSVLDVASGDLSLSLFLCGWYLCTECAD